MLPNFGYDNIYKVLYPLLIYISLMPDISYKVVIYSYQISQYFPSVGHQEKVHSIISYPHNIHYSGT